MQVEEINLTDPAFWSGPVNTDAFALLREQRPVSWHDFLAGPEQDSQGFWAVTRYEDIVAVSKNSELFRNEPSTYIGDQSQQEAEREGWFLNMDPPRHFKLRAVVQKIFSPRGVQRFRACAEAHARRLVLQADDGHIDFASDIAAPYPVAVICDILGAPAGDQALLHKLTTQALAGDAPELGGPASIPPAFAALNEYGADLAAEKRRSSSDDVVSQLLQAEVDGRKFSDEEVGIFFQLLVTAGMETTATVGSHMMQLFIQYPEQLSVWASDPDGVSQSGVEELVRLVSPVMHMRRTAASDTNIAGQAIAAGDKVVMWYISGNRDERQFVDADIMNVRRSPNRHIGFGGGGRHTCLGAHLARLELPILAREVVTRIKQPEPAGDAVYLASRFANGLISLPIRCRYQR